MVCEILPTARGELAKELVKVHGFTQAAVAQLFGVTSAAVSQYIKGLRGGNPYVDSSSYRDEFYRSISVSAEKIAKDGADITEELCTICKVTKNNGMLDEIYKRQGEKIVLTKCLECPRTNFVIE